MLVRVESEFDCEIENFWQHLLSSNSFVYIVKPLVSVKPHQPKIFPVMWQQEQTLIVRPYLFCLIPMPLKTINMEVIDDQAHFIQTREFDAMIKVWDHAVSVQRVGKNKIKYSDSIEIQAGLLTPLVCGFAKWFYRHRQNRWCKLISKMKSTGS